MPTKRRRRSRNRRPEISPKMLAYLNDDADRTPIELLIDGDRLLSELWRDHGQDVLSQWVAERPGTRPICWWKFDAPKWQTDDPCHAGWYYMGELPEPRKRHGGTGTPCFEVLAHVPHWPLGIPDFWVSDFDVDYYAPDFAGVAVDPLDPPQFESQAAYLDRHGLFFDGERERLTAVDFEPEILDLEIG